MPARVIDDSIYLSDKIKALKPEHRAEYSYLLPLTEANGVLEVNPGRIWAAAYSYHRTGIDIGWVQDLLDDLKQQDLLRTWEEAGKTWGWWVGIDKPGRLPSKEHLKRYKNLPPYPPLRIREDSFFPEYPGPDQSGTGPGQDLS